jgi:tetratricopeptide (TPR) repeat protein
MKKPLLFLAVIISLFSACKKEKDQYLDAVTELEQTEYRGQELSDKRTDEIKAAIKSYQDEVDKKVKASEQLGIYYKMLAVRYMDGKMYEQAYKNLEKAIEIYPENPILFYLSGVSAARVAMSRIEASQRQEWLARSEAYYLHALELDPIYIQALYGLAVLLVFELDRPEAAEPYLLRILAREKQNTDAMFLLANVYYRSGRLEEALEVYGNIAGTTQIEERARQAAENKKKIEEELHGGN